MICPQCKGFLPDDEKICPACKHDFSQPSAAPAARPASVSSGTAPIVELSQVPQLAISDTPAKRSGMTVVLAGSVVALLILFGVGYAGISVMRTSVNNAAVQPVLETTVYELPDFTIRYPSDWTVAATDADENGISGVSFGAPSDGDNDTFQEKVAISVLSNATEEDISGATVQIRESAISYDPAPRELKSVVQGVEVYELIFTDKSGSLYGEPVVVHDFIFMRGDSVYVIRQVMTAIDDAHIEKYVTIFNAMTQSITFR